jgi:hypothetical protein
VRAGEALAKELLFGNYPLTVGNENPYLVTVSHGKVRMEWRERPSVRVPDVILKSVGFIGEVTHRDSSGISGDLHGTGFFIAIPSSITGLFFFCFVTALHVVKDLLGREIYVLVNKKGGGVTALSSLAGSGLWTHPTDPTADVAVIPMSQDPSADYIAVAVKDFATPELMQAQNIGIGDEVVITGLFTPAPGTKRNMPIIRHGNIAMLPEEQIETDMGYADVYLVEARSIGGLSGSPVFARPTVFVQVVLEDGTTRTLHGIGDQYPLLGMMHGHWDIRESEINSPQVLHDRKRGVNYGIGIVVPATKIIETINRPELLAMRKRFEEEFTRDRLPTPDSAKQETKFTKADFEQALKKASRKIEPKKK